MQVKNSKSLFHFLTEQMDKLDKDEITVEKAKGQAGLAKEVNNVLLYELKRVNTLISLSEHNANQNYKAIQLREVESTAFDKTN